MATSKKATKRKSVKKILLNVWFDDDILIQSTNSDFLFETEKKMAECYYDGFLSAHDTAKKYKAHYAWGAISPNNNKAHITGYLNHPPETYGGEEQLFQLRVPVVAAKRVLARAGKKFNLQQIMSSVGGSTPVFPLGVSMQNPPTPPPAPPPPSL